MTEQLWRTLRADEKGKGRVAPADGVLQKMDGSGAVYLTPVTEGALLIEDGERMKRVLTALALAENGGDVVDELLALAELLGWPHPDWSDEQGRYVWPWEG